MSQDIAPEWRKHTDEQISDMTGTTTAERAANFSKNELAGELLGLRPIGAVAVDMPCELGYHCPVCVYPLEIAGNYDERLGWSEYNGFLYCYECNRDYPSALCQPDIDAAIDAFMVAISLAVEISKTTNA